MAKHARSNDETTPPTSKKPCIKVDVTPDPDGLFHVQLKIQLELLRESDIQTVNQLLISIGLIPDIAFIITNYYSANNKQATFSWCSVLQPYVNASFGSESVAYVDYLFDEKKPKPAAEDLILLADAIELSVCCIAFLFYGPSLRRTENVVCTLYVKPNFVTFLNLQFWLSAESDHSLDIRISGRVDWDQDCGKLNDQ